jgi:hypothetical protein
MGLVATFIGILTLSKREFEEMPSTQPLPWPTSTQEGNDKPSIPHPPSSLQAGRARNHAAPGTEYIDVLQWQPNLDNVDTEIANFRIYRLNTGQRDFLAEVNSKMCEHWVSGITEDITRHYGVTTVARDGRESIPAVVSIDAVVAQ